MDIDRFNRKDRWFTLKNNFKVEEYISFDIATSQTDVMLIVKQSFKELFKPNSSAFNWSLSSFSFYDKDENSIKYSINNWAIEEIEMTYKSSTTTSCKIFVTDPKQSLKEVRCGFIKSRRSSYNDIDMDVVINAILKFHEISQFNFWEEYYLMKENDELKKKIIEREDEIDNLKKGNEPK